MIIEMLLDVIFNIISLTMNFHIPQLPPEVIDYIDQAFIYLSAGAGILANYTPLQYLLTLFGIILLVDIGINVYNFVLWILKKIPVLGIE